MALKFFLFASYIINLFMQNIPRCINNIFLHISHVYTYTPAWQSETIFNISAASSNGIVSDSTTPPVEYSNRTAPLKKSIVFLKHALKMDFVKGGWFDLYE